MLLALTEAQRAVEIAPDYGLAHAMLADAAATVYMWLVPDDPQEVRKITASIDTAIVLEPDNAVVLAHLAEAYNYVGRPDDALRLALRARTISPSCGLAHYAAGVATTQTNRIDAASEHFEDELRAAPGSHTLYASHTWRGAGQLRLRNWQTALDWYEAAWQHNSMSTGVLIGQAIANSYLGNTPQAHAQIDQLRKLDPATTIEVWQRCMKRWFINCDHEPEMTALLTGLWHEAKLA